MHKMMLSTATVLIALSACSSEPAQKAAASGQRDTAEMVAAAAQTAEIRAGQYETRLEMIRFDMPGIPPAMQEQMRTQMAAQFQQATSTCLSEAEAAQGRRGRLTELARGNDQCQMQDMTTRGDRVTGRLVCGGVGGRAGGGPGGVNATISFDGTLTAESSDMTVTSVIASPVATGQDITNVMRVTSRRVGACTGREASASASATATAASPAAPATGKPAR